jgi:glutaredoxin-like protein NrdH
MDAHQCVKMYTLSTCSHCKAAKELMKQLRVEYDFTDVDLLQGEERQSAIAEVRNLNPRLSFPTIVIGDRVIVGNRQDEIKQALGLS